jgi:PKD repeat protein
MRCNHVADVGAKFAVVIVFLASAAILAAGEDSKITCKLSFSPASGTAPLSTAASGTCSGGTKRIKLTLNWGDGSKPAVSDKKSLQAQHTYASAGTYTAVLTAKDSKGHTGSATQAVTASKAKSKNQPPTCQFSVSPSNGPAPLGVRGDGSCSDPDGNLGSTSISWGDGSTTPGHTGSHTYSKPGTFTASLTGTDSHGAQGSASQKVTVTAPANRPPTCSLTLSNPSGTAPVAVNATAACADPEGALSSVVLDFGDGFYAGAASASHTYGSAGTFVVTVVAVDKAGNASGPAQQTVTVSAPPAMYAGISNGQVAQYDKFGNRLAALDSRLGGSMTGMAFDATGNLYATAFTAAKVAKFTNGASAGTFGSQYNCKPESIAFDQAGNAYVGQAGCSHALLKFDAYGNLVTSYKVATEQTGSDWIDIAPDQCTLYYSSEGASVLRYNVCTKQQLPAFSSALKKALSLRILPDGGVVVANLTDIIRLDSAGRVVTTYDAPGDDCWASLTLDDDGVSFWAADYCTSDIARFELSSPAPVFQFKSGTAPNTVFAVAVRAATPAVNPAGPLVAASPKATVSAGQSAAYKMAFSPARAASGESFTFTCANLPADTSCSFSPASVTATSAGASTTLTVVTQRATAGLVPPNAGRNLFALLLPGLPLLLLAIPLPRPTKRRRRLLFLAALLLMLAMVACGGGGSSSSPAPATPSSAPSGSGTTPSGTYTVLVRASSANMQSSTPVTLVVQ